MKNKLAAIAITSLLCTSLYAQQELIGPIPKDRGILSQWKEPNLLPEKYAKNLRYEAITYGRDGLMPLPSTSFGYKLYDWNGDGFDDIVGCNYPFHYGDPYILVYLSSGGNNTTFTDPFKSQVILTDSRLGRYFDFMDVDGDGKDEIITFDPKKKNIIAFKNIGDISKPVWEVVDIKDADGKNWDYLQDVLETPSFTITDWDNDGRKDLVAGMNHPSRMVHGYGIDPNIMHPDAYRIYFVKNIGNNGKAVFGNPQLITCDGEPLKYLGWAYPLTYDFDHDGLPDLVCGEHKPGIRVYKNMGGSLPTVKFIGNLMDELGRELVDNVYFHLEMGDLTGDGKKEFVSTTQFSGTTYYYPLFATGDSLKWQTGEYLKFNGNAATPIWGPAICTVEPDDWDGDGDTDFLLGAEPGMPMLLKNIGSDKKPVYANPEFIKFYDGSPVRTYSIELGDGSSHGAWEWYDDRIAPTVADWDGDGIKDLISSTQGRRIYWMKGKMVKDELRFSSPMKFKFGGDDVLHPHRCKLGVVDWNRDGKMDLIALNTISELVIYLGNGTSNLNFANAIYLRTTRNEPLVSDLSIVQPPLSSSLSGRTGVAIFDWDNDGYLDIITHKHRGTVLYYRNTGKGVGVFEPARVMFDFDSHLAGPTIMDYNQDGYPDIILGGDRKRFVGEKKLFPKPIRAHLMWYDGSSLPFPSKKR